MFPPLQLYDYSQLGFGLKDGAFGTLFYVMTGIHMAHVVGGVVFLVVVFGQAVRGRISAAHHDSLAAGAITGISSTSSKSASSRSSTC